jgi:hypothetical protein
VEEGSGTGVSSLHIGALLGDLGRRICLPGTLSIS